MTTHRPLDSSILQASVAYDPLLLGEIVNHPTLPIGLICYYRLESDGSDAGKRGLDGTLVGSPTFVAGKIGNCISLNGSTQYVNLGTDANFEMPLISVAAWAKLSVASGYKGIVTKRSNPAPHIQWALQTEGGLSKYTFCIQFSGTDRWVASTTSLDTNWHHLVGTYDGKTMKLFVDGVLEGENPMSMDMDSIPTMPIYIGARATGTSPYTGFADPFGGLIDEVGIWRRALTPEEVEALYNGNSGLPFS